MSLSSSGPSRLEDVKDRVVEQINAGNGKALFEMYNPAMRETFPVERTASFVDEVRGWKGRWQSARRVPGPEPLADGTWRVQAERGEVLLRLHLDGNGGISGLKVTEAAKPPPVARNQVPMALPVRGEWRVLWGGDRIELNRHLANADQRRAVDLVMVGPDDRTHRGEGRANSDYLAYGQDVLAAADGTVVTVVDGLPENEPGERNPYVVPGNFVLVRHTPTLYSSYEHLQPGQIRTKTGAEVRRGEVIGLCGNSGNSTQPHLHFQLQDGAVHAKSWGVEAAFENVTVTRDGKIAPQPLPALLQGDRVRAAP